MIDLNHCNEWQHRDPTTGLVFPWYTKSFLDELVTWDLKDKVVLEIGMGASTLWWHRKCKKVYGCDTDAQYVQAVSRLNAERGWLHWLTTTAQTVQFIKDYGAECDIIIIDGEPIDWRDDCVKPALDCLKPSGKLIIDNWLQPSVGWMPSEETQQLLSKYPVKIYPQEGHPDWKTAVFEIGKVIDKIDLKEVSLLSNGQYGIGFTTH